MPARYVHFNIYYFFVILYHVKRKPALAAFYIFGAVKIIRTEAEGNNIRLNILCGG